MDQLSLEIGIRATDFIQISAGFLLTMLCFFGAKNKRFLNNSLLLLFVLQCVFFILFHEGVRVKLFAFLMLLSTLTVEVLVAKKRNLIARNG
jgi:hypothetical protein